MKKRTLVMLGTAAAIAAGAFPATVTAHGDDPKDEGAAIARALKKPLVVKGSARLTILHVQKGCHVWSRGSSKPAPGAKVTLRRGQRITIVNQDLDAHKLLRLEGPRIALGKKLAFNDRVTLRFTKTGVYKLRTKKIEIPGGPKFSTTGVDYILALVVVVR
jgi:plastocyanin